MSEFRTFLYLKKTAGSGMNSLNCDITKVAESTSLNSLCFDIKKTSATCLN